MGQKKLKCLRCESEMYLLEHEGFLLGDKHLLARGGYLFTGRLHDFDDPKCPGCGLVQQQPPTILNSI